MKHPALLWDGLLFVMVIILGIEWDSQAMAEVPDAPCSTDPLASVAQMLDQTSEEQWLGYLSQLTGEEVIHISGQATRISTRFTPSLFDGTPDGLAVQYIKDQLSIMQYPASSIAGQYGFYEESYPYQGKYYQNIILTIPGQEWIVPADMIISAHLDDLPLGAAPGADDNGVGAAALLEIARVLRYYQFGASIHLVWFTGGEQGQLGSTAYLLNRPLLFETLIGDINLDGYGYDADQDNCFEIHAGSLGASYVLGDCMLKSIVAYQLPLKADYIRSEIPEGISDQISFWEFNLPAIGIQGNRSGRNISDPSQRCGDAIEVNPNQHTSQDRIQQIDISQAFMITRAGLATAALLSVPEGACFSDQPSLTGEVVSAFVHLVWDKLDESSTYRVYRSLNACQGPWEKRADFISVNEFYDVWDSSPLLAYRLEAVDSSGQCVSLESNCLRIRNVKTFLPIMAR